MVYISWHDINVSRLHDDHVNLQIENWEVLFLIASLSHKHKLWLPFYYHWFGFTRRESSNWLQTFFSVATLSGKQCLWLFFHNRCLERLIIPIFLTAHVSVQGWLASWRQVPSEPQEISSSHYHLEFAMSTVSLKHVHWTNLRARTFAKWAGLLFPYIFVQKVCPLGEMEFKKRFGSHHPLIQANKTWESSCLKKTHRFTSYLSWFAWLRTKQ